MNEFTNLKVDDFLDRIAGRTPTPGGGAVAAASGALACAMGCMVAAYSIGKKTEPTKRARVESALERLARADRAMRRLIAEDAAAYTRLTEAAKDVTESESAKPVHQAALATAILVPLEMMALASETLAVLDEFKEDASGYLLSDLGVAAVLAEATARAACYSVLVNLRDLQQVEDRRHTHAEVAHLLDRSSRHRKSIEDFVSPLLGEK
ncbi:MAG: cyclodeaminase/cyclohydrolase family protein [Phycisphaerales bacterium]|nr:MAG: cyclodeaminase/cyclohydrolase family protein [Phycisphaerales bacterium]